MNFHDLETPCALVDPDVLEGNVRAMSERAGRLGVRLRPHTKTHKCVEVARLQVRGSFGGITVSTLAEAERFADAGFGDITYAVPIAPGRVERAARLEERIERLALLVDHVDAAMAVERHGARRGRALPVFLKVDCGYHRAGVLPDSDEALGLARNLAHSQWIEFRGILTHAGHAYHSRGREEARAIAEQERDVMVAFRDRLASAGVRVSEISVGSTPTMCAAEDLGDVTEMRPGNYAFFDAFQTAIGSCRREEIAFGVLATVIGSYPRRNESVIDAGTLALSRDPGPIHVDPDCGFGIPVVPGTREPLAGARVAGLSQEHGVLRLEPGDGGTVPRVGERIVVLPNHSCLAAALFDRYHVVRGEEVVDVWRPVRGW
jgi:D-serine deaminase-like pyridoxal phosphate-dependent protein